MNSKWRIVLTVFGVILAIFLMWYFSTITGYVIGAIVITMVISPLMEYLSRRKIGKRPFPRWLAAIVSLLVVLVVFLGIIGVIVPLIAKEAKVVSEISYSDISGYLTTLMDETQHFLKKYDLIDESQELGHEIAERVKSFISIKNVGTAFTSVFSALASMGMALFAIFFISFFLLKDKAMFLNVFLSIFRKDKQYKVRNVLHKTRVLLSRYFIGLTIQLTVMITLESIGLTIFKIPNAFLIGFVGGFMNIIPYIGPIIGGAIGVVLAVISAMALGNFEGLLWVIVKVVIVFVAANIVDNTVNQPLIFSKSVNAHPIEIFIVTIAAGYIGGIGAMIVAIPAYTVIRIILKEYLSELAFINNITKNV